MSTEGIWPFSMPRAIRARAGRLPSLRCSAPVCQRSGTSMASGTGGYGARGCPGALPVLADEQRRTVVLIGQFLRKQPLTSVMFLDVWQRQALARPGRPPVSAWPVERARRTEGEHAVIDRQVVDPEARRAVPTSDVPPVLAAPQQLARPPVEQAFQGPGPPRSGHRLQPQLAAAVQATDGRRARHFHVDRLVHTVVRAACFAQAPGDAVVSRAGVVGHAHGTAAGHAQCRRHNVGPDDLQIDMADHLVARPTSGGNGLGLHRPSRDGDV